MIIPSIPEKNVYKTEAFIKSRMRGLTLFLNNVMKSPYLRGDASVIAFLTVGDDHEWEQAKKVSLRSLYIINLELCCTNLILRT